MPQLNRLALKAFFEAGDTPTESQFVDLIDSLLNIIDDNHVPWQKTTINFDDFQPDAAKIKFITAFNVPAGEQVYRFIIHPTISFSGGPITDAHIVLYEETDNAPYENTDINVFSVISNKSGRVSPGHIKSDDYLIDFQAGSDIHIRLEIVGIDAEINDLTQGSFDIYYKSDKIA